LIIKFEAYPLGLRVLEFGTCSNIPSEANIRNKVGCEEKINSTAIRVKRRNQLFLKCTIHHLSK
jgi:hypothetical protein